jgi:hypothetical protein
LTRAYLDAFAARDLGRCLAFYAENASIDFQVASVRGRPGVEQWHRDRFAANLRLVRLESLEVRGDSVVVDGVVASDRLAAWGLDELGGRLTLSIELGKVTRARFTPRMMNPLARLDRG